MAKGKRAVALFEVIHKDKRFDKKSPPPPEKSSTPDSQQFAKQAVEQWRKNHYDPETWTPPGPTLGESFSALVTKLKTIYSSLSAHLSAIANYLRLWISRSNGVIPGVAAAALVIAVMLAARHWLRPVSVEPTVADALRSRTPNPNVLIVPDSNGANNSTGPSPEMALDEQQANAQQASARQLGAQPAAERTIPSLAAPGQRIVNMHYILMQSYFEQKTAQEACDFLNTHGIPCTIERGIKGWRPDFYQVIGLQGFVHATGPQYEDYRDQIIDLGKKFAPKSRYKRFQPEAIKW